MTHATGTAPPARLASRQSRVSTIGRWLAIAVSIGVALIETRPAFATPAWTNGQQHISAIIWRPGYRGFYVSSGTFDNPQSCSVAGGNLYLLDPAVEANATETNRLFALIMSAQAQGKTLFVWIDGCQNGVPQFTGLQMND